jgi:predicted lipase
MGGANGTKENLPVGIEVLTEMAEYCERIYDEGKEIGDNEFAYNVVQDRGVTIISIRGTDNSKNVLTDLDARPFRDRKLGVQIHRGFRDAAEKLRDDILENVALEETIILTGHSLGGAIAQILGLWFEDDAYEVQIYTFGSPSVLIEQMWEDGHFRVYLENDPVPFLPPFPYVHWGIRINAETLDWDEDHPIGDVSKIDARDHSIKEYLKVLRRHYGRL